MTGQLRIVVVGLGYVGLPLAVALARKFDTIGFDIDAERISELQKGFDRTQEVDEAALSEAKLELAMDPGRCNGADIYIVTVPTPLDAQTVLTSTRFWRRRGWWPGCSRMGAVRRLFTKARCIPASLTRFAAQKSSVCLA